MSRRRQVSFTHRPNKAYVRSELIRLVGLHTSAMKRPGDHSYISLAGYRFLDTVELYRSYRVRSLFSIESDGLTYVRARFNRPYSWVTLFHGRLPDFIARYDSRLRSKSKIIFLDYNGRLSREIIEDLDALFDSEFYERGGLLFLTVNSGHKPRPPYLSEIMAPAFHRRSEYEEWLRSYIPSIIRRKLRARFPHMDTRELAKFLYRDTSPMMVLALKVDEEGNLKSPYMPLPFEKIDVPDLTPIERHTLRRYSTTGHESLRRKTGISPREIEFFLKHE